jgi:hypothetical protein
VPGSFRRCRYDSCSHRLNRALGTPMEASGHVTFGLNGPPRLPQSCTVACACRFTSIVQQKCMHQETRERNRSNRRPVAEHRGRRRRRLVVNTVETWNQLMKLNTRPSMNQMNSPFPPACLRVRRDCQHCGATVLRFGDRRVGTAC